MLALVFALALLPSGTYHYDLYDSGKVAGTSVVTVSRDAASVVVREDAKLGSGPVSTVKHFDPQTFSLLTFQYLNQPGVVGEVVSFSDKGAAYHEKDQGLKTLAPPVAGAPSQLFDFLAGGFTAVPAMLHATGAASYNDYCVCPFGFDVKAAAIVPTTMTHPKTALASDVAVSLKQGDDTVTLWYDPATFLLREVDFGTSPQIVRTD